MHLSQPSTIPTNKYLYPIIRIVIVLGILLLPYCLFYPQHFIGGDDTRIFTVFPHSFLKQITLYSWFHFSALGLNNPNQFFIPLTTGIYLLQQIIPVQTVVSYLCFSLPLIFGFIYFEKFSSELVGSSRKAETHIGALLYIASPIMIVTQWSIFLTGVWLIGLFPALMYYYIRYITRKKVIHLYFACILSLVASAALFSIPWLLGYILPLCASIPVVMFLKIPLIRTGDFWRRTILFIASIAITQSFWLLPFAQAMLSPSPNSIGSYVASDDVQTTFTDTINATAVGTVIYPMLNLFHYQIAYNFHWSQLSVFTNYYEPLAWLNILFPAVILYALYKSKQALPQSICGIFLPLLAAYILSLYLFTINIGALKQIFLALGAIPGWVMFRNSFDKFAPGYVFYFSLLVTFSLVIIKNSLAKYRLLFIAITVLILINGIPFSRLINHPLWTTKNVLTTTTIPTEYTDFMQTVEANVPATSNIISLPLNNAGYGIIPIPNSHHTYIGQSLVEIFSHRYDFSGNLSFPAQYRKIIHTSILNNDYSTLVKLFRQLNIGYVITTENISQEIQQSYLFDQKAFEIQTSPDFRKHIEGEVIAESKQKNFHLYKLNNTQSDSLVSLPRHIYRTPNPKTLWEKILPFFNQDSIVIESTDSVPDTVPKNLYFPTKSSPSYLVPGKYTVATDSPQPGTISFNPDTHTIEQTADVAYTLYPESPDADRVEETIFSDIQEKDLLMLNNTFIEAHEISNMPVGPKSTIKVFTKDEENILPSTQELSSTWDHGDCNAYTNDPLVHISTTDETLTLQSEKQHDACIYGAVTLDKKTVYTLEFDYRGTSSGKAVYIDINEPQKISHTVPASSDWRHSSVSFLNKESGPIQVYFYSGSSNDTSSRDFKNIRLSSQEQRKEKSITPLPRTSNSFTLDTPAILSLHTPEVQIFLPPLENWSKGDCAAIDEKKSVSFSVTENNGVRLNATDGHNACIYATVPVNPNAAYDLSVNVYSTTERALSVLTSFNNKGESLSNTISVPEKQWHTVNAHIQVPSESNVAYIYLYSGANKSETSETEYKNVSLVSYPQAYDTLTLYRQPDQEYALPQAATARIEKISPVAYRVHTKHVPSKFLLQFKESFNTGWNIYPGNNYRWYTPLVESPLNVQHVMSNKLNNGWWLEHEELCSFGNCTGQANDYSADFLIVFTPQRWFHIGSAITAAFLLLISTWTTYTYLRNRYATRIN